MWLENLKELKKEKGLSVKQIAELTRLPERTVARIFSGDTPNPYIDTIHRIVTMLGGSLDDILADSNVVVGSRSLTALQEKYDAIVADRDRLLQEKEMLIQQHTALTAEAELLRLKLEHKEELLALYKLNFKLNQNEGSPSNC